MRGGTPARGRYADSVEKYHQITHTGYNVLCSPIPLFPTYRPMSELPPSYAAWPAGGGALGALIRTHDWAATPLGPVENWPPALRTVVDLVVHSPLPMTVLWGPDQVQVYNDSYAT